MKEKDQFEAQRKAIKFQEIYYPSDRALLQDDLPDAIQFAFAQGFEMAQRLTQKRLDEKKIQEAKKR